MNFKRMMPVAFLLLVILTIGAVSASDDTHFNETLTVNDADVKPIEEIDADILNETESDSLGATDDETIGDDKYNTGVKIEQEFDVNGDDCIAWITLEPELRNGGGSFVILNGNNAIYERPLTEPTGDARKWHDSEGDLKCNVYLGDVNLTQVNDSDDLKFTFIDGYGNQLKRYTENVRVYRNASTIMFYYPLFPMEFAIDCEREFPISNLQAIFANVTVSRDVTGRLVLRNNASILFEKSTDSYNESLIHGYDYGLALGDEGRFIFTGLMDGDVVTFEFFNSEGSKVMGYSFFVHFKNDTVMFEDIGYDDSLYFIFMGGSGEDDGWSQYGLLMGGMSLEPKLIHAGGSFVISDGDFVMYSSPTTQSARNDPHHWHVGLGFFKCHAYSNDIKLENVSSGDLIKFTFIDSEGMEVEKYTIYRFISISGSRISFLETIDPNLKINIKDINYGQNALLTVTTHALFSGNVSVRIGDSYYNVTVINGSGKISVSGLAAGEYKVIAEFNATNMFDASTKSTAFNVKLKTILKASGVTTTYGTSKKIVVTLTDVKGNVLTDKYVTIVFNGVKKVLKTNLKGQVSLTVPATLAVKKYIATLTFAGDDMYLKSSKSVNVVVSKAKVKLAASNRIFKLKQVKKYIVVLKTDKGKAMAKTLVTINVNGVKYTVKTDSTGKATFNLKKLIKIGRHTAKVTFSGNNNFYGLTKSVIIIVKK